MGDLGIGELLVEPVEGGEALAGMLVLLGDPESANVKQKLALPEDPEARVKEMIRRFTVSASVAHFTWPIAERGLSKRLRRISADTLVLWGRDDALMDACYAQDFAAQIPSGTVEYVSGAGHTPHFDKPEAVAESIRKFLGR